MAREALAFVIAAVDEGERAAALAAALAEWQHVLTDLELRCGDGTGIIVSCMTRTRVWLHARFTCTAQICLSLLLPEFLFPGSAVVQPPGSRFNERDAARPPRAATGRERETFHKISSSLTFTALEIPTQRSTCLI